MAGDDADSRVRAIARRALSAVRSREGMLLCAALAVSFVVDAVFLVPSFGEDDAAQFANDAVDWHLRGESRPDMTDYRMRLSPLYTHTLKLVLDAGAPIGSLPAVMNWTNVIASVWVLAAIYLLFRSVVGASSAVVACILYAVTPAAWLGGIYGMAHVPAVGFWLAALLVFSAALSEEVSPRRFWVMTAIATLIAFMALSLKADFVLSGLAFPGLAFVRRRLTLRNAAAACIVVLGALLLQTVYVGAVSVAPPSSNVPKSLAEYLAYWHKRFPFEISAVTDRANFGAVTNATGPFLFVIVVFALVAHLTSRQGLRLGLWAAGWALPRMTFFAFIDGNSVRHNFVAIAPLLLLVAVLLLRLAETRARAFALLGAVIAINYVSDVRGEAYGHGTMVPKTNLIRLANDVARASASRQREARKFVEIRAPKKAGLDKKFLVYTKFETAAAADREGRLSLDGEGFRIERKGAPPEIVVFPRVTNQAQATRAARSLRKQGFTVWSHDFNL